MLPRNNTSSRSRGSGINSELFLCLDWTIQHLSLLTTSTSSESGNGTYLTDNLMEGSGCMCSCA